MTPQERELVIDLFDRLGTLEDNRRDPDAERLIRDGLRQAPNAVYSLVQTVLVQDEALKRADERIRELEARDEPERRDTSFLGGMRQSLGSRTGSVPSVRPDGAGPSPAWQSERAAPAQPAQYERAPAQYQQPPPQQQQTGFTGSSFLGTAAAAAAGMIGGSLLLSSFRNMFGQSNTGHSAFGSFGDGNQSASGGNNANSELARSAGIDDIGRSQSNNDGRSTLLDNNDSTDGRASLFGNEQNARDDNGGDADTFFGDSDMDVGSSDE